ncbi:MAG: 16S rRNA (guanine(966)-N(2))-methyltransferase RsmD [Bacteroidales bacterium]|jgi:16S rRNA (guanine(966)-N(2))-methyltransferase RsmD|nr:16S rRNA (guanine(966)-N(2))-methyltransferase RsmD [Bacteroidales bacterium]
MRIIRGKYQRRQITAPNNLPVRPTTDMAKESLFNILENHVDFEDITVLDLFAGTGNISYELVSRGCPRVTAVDENNNCIKFIRDTAAKLNMEELLAIRSDVFRFIPMHKAKYDLIFADPPYDSQHYDLLVSLIFEHNLLKEDGMLVVEHNKFVNFNEHPRFVEQRRYGKVNFSFFK